LMSSRNISGPQDWLENGKLVTKPAMSEKERIQFDEVGGTGSI
jgi:hypothetical protein